jgi:ABC-type dipeptide/oligopeptide/nickel transport system permease component
LAIVELAGWTRYIRAQMLEVIRQDYIRTARAKGLNERLIILRHAFRNALLPLITLFGLSIPQLLQRRADHRDDLQLAGDRAPDVDSAVSRDYTMIMGTVLLSSTMVVLAISWRTSATACSIRASNRLAPTRGEIQVRRRGGVGAMILPRAHRQRPRRTDD